MQIADIASEIYDEMGSPSTPTVPSIAYWLRNNVGQLNNALMTSYYVNTTTLEIEKLDEDDDATVVALGEEEKAVFKKIYFIHYYDTEIRKNVLTYTSSNVIEVTSDGNTVRVASPTEIGKNLSSFRKAMTEELTQMIHMYRSRLAVPRQVAGDDTVEGTNDLTSINTYVRSEE